MRIVAVKGYAIRFPFLGGGFTTSYGRRAGLANLLLALETDASMTGYGEVCQTSGATRPPLDDEVVADIAQRCERLVGAEALEIAGTIGLLGAGAGANLRCGVETALWDLMGKAAGEPLARLLGGRRSGAMPVYVSIGSDEPAAMARAAAVARRRGVVRFQVKIAGASRGDVERMAAVASELRPGESALVDANGAMTVAEALELAAATEGLDVLFEEPCRSYAENLEFARAAGRPVVLDQCMTSLPLYARAVAAGAFAGVCVKPTVLGGIAAARTARDLCIAAELPLKMDDSWAADAGSMAALHLAAGVPAELLQSTVDMRGYFEGAMFAGGAVTRDGATEVGDEPGLGLTPLPDRFGRPLFACA